MVFAKAFVSRNTNFRYFLPKPKWKWVATFNLNLPVSNFMQIIFKFVEFSMRVCGQTGGCAELHCASHQRKRGVCMDARSYTAHHTRGREVCVWLRGVTLRITPEEEMCMYGCAELHCASLQRKRCVYMDARSYTAHHSRGRENSQFL